MGVNTAIKTKASELICHKLSGQMNEVEFCELPRGKLAYYSTPNPLDDQSNEDSAFFYSQGDSTVLAVADGVGGSRGGKQAADLAIDFLQKGLTHTLEEGTPKRETLLQVFEEANQAILHLGIGAATTLMVVFIEGQELQTLHVGDSACLLVGGGGKFKFRSVDHSVAGYGQEAELIEAGELYEHGERHVLLNCLGSTEMRVDLGPKKKLSPRDRLVVASDGLFDNLKEEELAEILRKGPLRQQANQLKKLCESRMQRPQENTLHKPDDLSFFVYRPFKVATSKVLNKGME